MNSERVVYFCGKGTWCIEGKRVFVDDSGEDYEADSLYRMLTAYEEGLFKLPSINEQELHYSNKCTVSILLPFEHNDGIDEGFDLFKLEHPATFHKSAFVSKTKLKVEEPTPASKKRESKYYNELNTQVCKDALYILENNPKLCVNTNNKVVGTRLRKAVINKWKEDNKTKENHPLKARTIDGYLSKFLNENPQILQKLQFKF